MEGLVIDPVFWRGKRVLVTGHTGFKGSWLSLWLQQLGAKVTGFALAPPSNPSLFERAEVGRGMHSMIGDVRDASALARAVQGAAPDIVIHMAAQSLVRTSYAQPVETYATNVMGTVHLLEAVRATPSVRAALVVTSDKCYANREWVWGYREDEAMGGHDPYSSSKGCAELVTAAYRSSFFAAEARVAVATARAGNVIGGGDWAKDRLVPDAMRGFASGVTVPVRHPDAVRPWQHVLEPLAGYLLLCERLFAGAEHAADAWNFGAEDGDSRPVSWIIARLASRWGEGAHWETVAAPPLHEATLLRLDCSRSRHLLGWRSLLTLDETLDWIVEWHRGALADRSTRELTEAQIARYQSRATRVS